MSEIIQPYQQPASDVVAALKTDPRAGLSDAEAQARLQQYGPNALKPKPPVPAWRRFLAQFQSPLVILLLVATLISFIVWLVEQDESLPFESIAIFAIVLLNAILGYIQEERAGKSVAALMAMSAATASVVRGGQLQRIPATDVVPGDVLQLEEGDTVAADSRLLEVHGLQAAEAPLTGESQPVTKRLEPVDGDVPLGDRLNMVFNGSAITYGRGRAVVTGTGMNTEVGKIAGLLQATKEEPTPLQIEIEKVSKVLGIAVIIIAIITIAAVLLTQPITSVNAIVDALIFGVSLAVAAVPEGLATIMTVVLALGVQRMAQRNAIMRKLSAVETLGSANVICTDKTGTLTKNEMTVRTVITASGRADFGGIGYEPKGEVLHDGEPLEGALRHEVERTLRAATLANNSVLQQRDGRWSIQGDPTEGSLKVASAKLGLRSDALESRFARMAEVPFSSERKMMSTVHDDAEMTDRVVIFAKGAPDVLLARCSHERVGEESVSLTEQRRKEILASVDQMASEALRTLGVAYRPEAHQNVNGDVDEGIEHDFTFLGLIGMIDPPRPEAKEAVKVANSAGIRVIMITGDHPRTAQTIASELGIIQHDARVIAGPELNTIDDAQLRHVVKDVSCYARVSPEHKLKIVRALKENGNVAAMTGDGVNDAPALKTADIGVAMGITGTDVSKEAADMVLADDNFASIVAAVEEGRGIFSNIRKFLRYLLSSNIGEVLTMFFGVMLAGFLGLRAGEGELIVLPLLATQILWINLVTDAAPALALGVDPVGRYIMRQKPRSRSQSVIDREMWMGIFFVGAVMAAGTLGVMDLALPGGFVGNGGELTHARTMAFTTLVLFQLFNVFNSRSDERSAFSGLFTNKWLWIAVGISMLMQVAVVHVAFLQTAFGTTDLSLENWLTCAAVASTVIWAREIFKFFARAIRKSQTNAVAVG
jgi:Ca2+-transporting ATPase